MRHLLIALAATLVSTAVSAQVPRYGASHVPPNTVNPLPPVAPRNAPAPQPPPLTPAGPPVEFPLPPLMTPPAGGLTHGFPGFFSRGDAQEFSPSRRRAPRTFPFAIPLVPGYIVSAEGTDTSARAPMVVEASGMLRLSVTPARAQVFVDGYYVGTIEDVANRRGLWLAAGPHRLELRAIGYRTLSVDVVITPRDTLTYEGELEFISPAAPQPSPAPAPAPSGPPIATGSSVMYVIPNCYMGNVPPRPTRLPAGCDIKNVEVLGRR